MISDVKQYYANTADRFAVETLETCACRHYTVVVDLSEIHSGEDQVGRGEHRNGGRIDRL